jgi:hypothetical protein
MKIPLLSFVIPIYKKHPETLERCLKSLFDMSFKDFEVICVFDGADTELQKVAEKYKTQEVVIDHGGAPKARNEGFKYSKGKYISFWDADCYAKPEMAKRWMEEFESDDSVDFVYTGYEFANGQGAVEGQLFDPYLLTCGNYIATMFPMKREIFPGFDESLQGAQDWDLWLSIVEKGHKGSYIEGYGFITEAPTKDSISGVAWSDQNYRTTLRTVQDKHGIPVRDIMVGSAMHKIKGLHIAKLMNADFNQFFDFRHNDYKLAFNLGFGENIRFANAPSDCVKVQYWMPWDIEALEQIPGSRMVLCLEHCKKEVDIHFVNEIFSQKRLAKFFQFMGMPEPEILALPSDVTDAETKLPEKYRVLLDVDERWHPMVRSIKQDLPYIQIDDLDFRTNPFVKVEDYSMLVSFKDFATIDEPIRRMLINGRNVISNVQAPYCGYIDANVNVKDFKQELIHRIRDGRYLKFNQEGKDFYVAQVNPDVFVEKLKSLMKKPELEVVA